MIRPTKADIKIEKLESLGGFQILRQSEIPLIESYSKILHIIDVNEIQTTLDEIKTDITRTFSTTEDILILKQLNIQTKKTLHNIKTITSHRNKRGLINLGGKIASWLFGTMDNDDKIEIEEHLKTTDFNNYNLITNSNKQIKINIDLQNNIKILQKRMNENQILTLRALNVTNEVTKRSIKNIHFLSVLNNLNLLNSEVDKIQQNIVFAKHGIMSHSILTDDEIDEYDIDVFKYKEIKSSLLRFDDKLIFAILIPNLTKELAVKYKIIPVPNNNFEEIVIENTNVIQFKNKMYVDNEEINIKQLKIANNCINNLINENYKNCQKIVRKTFEIIEISPTMILVKNGENTLTNDCNHVKYKLLGNNLISYNNCTLKINDVTFSNKERIVTNHIILPNYLSIKNVNLKINLEDVNIRQIENIKELKEIRQKTKHNQILTYIFVTILTTFVTSIIIIYLLKTKCFNYLKRKELETVALEDTQESVPSNGGGIIYPSIPFSKIH